MFINKTAYLSIKQHLDYFDMINNSQSNLI